MRASLPRSIVLAVLVICLPLVTDRAASAGDQAGGPLPRVPWTTSRVRGSSDVPPPYREETVFPHLRFNQPLLLVSPPGGGRLYVGEQGGKLYSFAPDAGARPADLVLDLKAAAPAADALYGLAFHPRFRENRRAYLCYTLPGETPEGTRVSRFEVSRSDPPRIERASERVIITFRSGGHNGGCLQFGPDGHLYVSTGDATAPSPPDALDTGQDLSDLLSSILRIDVDGEAEGHPYRVPPDNPFLAEPGARPEIWAYGLRNPWRMSFDRKTGDLWVGDVGWELWELVYRVERGGNYGWSVMEGRQPVRPDSRRGAKPITLPVIDHPHSEGASVTGGCVVRGGPLPALEGVYVYGDYVTGRIWGLRMEGRRVAWHERLAETPLQIVSFGEGPAGELYFLDHGGGKIHRLVPRAGDGANAAFPRTLGETGLFASVPDHVPAPGVLRYSVNAEPFSDGAAAERFLAVPGDSRIDAQDPLQWKFPEGTVLAKTISLPAVGGGRLRVETQLLHLEAGWWRPYVYAWNREGTEASLVEAGGAARRLPPAVPGSPERAWLHASRSECLLCHGALAGVVLGTNTLQLNREETFGGRRVNQLRALEEMGLFSRPWPEPPERLPRLSDPHDAMESLERRARSYLHANCSHCHRSGGGGTATIELVATLELEKTRTVGERPLQGAFGIPDARIIAPGDPCGSVLFYRLAKMGSGRMPRAGSSTVDGRGLALIHDWIAGLGGGPAVEPPQDTGAATSLAAEPAAAPGARSDAVRRLTASTRGALLLAWLVGSGSLREPVQKEVLAEVRSDQRVEVRDLFERFLPEEERIRRLDGVMVPAEVLSLRGDPARGSEIFQNDAAARCRSCHRIGDAGGAVGPDLSHIGKKYPPALLLEHIANPSKEVAPEFTTYALLTRSGRLATGVLVERSEREVVLRDALNEVVRVPAAEVKLLEKREGSLMPDLLLRGMTPQAAADLLSYLESLK